MMIDIVTKIPTTETVLKMNCCICSSSHNLLQQHLDSEPSLLKILFGCFGVESLDGIMENRSWNFCHECKVDLEQWKAYNDQVLELSATAGQFKSAIVQKMLSWRLQSNSKNTPSTSMDDQKKKNAGPMIDPVAEKVVKRKFFE